MSKQKPVPEVVPEPPPHLSERSAELWRRLVPGRARSVGRLTLLTAGLEALDRADQARRLIDGGELISKTESTGALHVHPGVKIERDNRALFAQIWAKLGLEWNQSEDGRWTS